MYRRDISAPLQFIRTLLMGRTWNKQSRFQPDISPRPYPKPNLTGGSAHKAAENYYCIRDARRAVLPPQVLSLKQIENGDSKGTRKAPSPGNVYMWD